MQMNGGLRRVLKLTHESRTSYVPLSIDSMFTLQFANHGLIKPEKDQFNKPATIEVASTICRLIVTVLNR